MAFGQLDHAGSIKATTAVLTGLRGRAALAWTRRSRPDLVYRARTALSPLATAIDRDGALWWASNPQWLREISNRHDLELSNPVQMREGTLIAVNSDHNQVSLVTHRRFTPTSRPHDERIAHTAAWRDSPSPIVATNSPTAATTSKVLTGRGESPFVEGPHAQRAIRSHGQEHADNGCQAGDPPQLTERRHRGAHRRHVCDLRQHRWNVPKDVPDPCVSR